MVGDVAVGGGAPVSVQSMNRTPCPSCGRAEVDVSELAEAVQAELQGLDVPLRVAVMGCGVNGPGEAREGIWGWPPATVVT